MASVKSYLFFDGRCEEAIEFYEQVLGAKLESLMRFKDAPDQSQISENAKEKVMHASFRIGDTEVLASDGYCQGAPEFKGFSLVYAVKDDAEAERLFAAIGEGGQVQMPLGESFFASRFGMLRDKFGVGWMVITETA